MRPILLILALLSLPDVAAAGTAPAVLPIPAGGIAIASPGTADLAGYRIVVAPSGDAVAVDLAGRTQRALPPALTKTLFADAAAAMPLSKLPAAPCPQPKAPAPVIVTFNGETSPDMTCLDDVKATALFADVQTVAHALYVSNLRSRKVPRFATGQSEQAPVPQPAAPAPPPPPPPGGYGGYGHM